MANLVSFYLLQESGYPQGTNPTRGGATSRN